MSEPTPDTTLPPKDAPLRLPGTNLDLRQVVKTLNPELGVDLRQEENFDAYDLRVSWLGYANVRIPGQKLLYPEHVIAEVDYAVKELEEYGRKVFKTEQVIAERDEQWRKVTRMLLLSAGIPADRADEVLNDVKEFLK